MWVNFATIITVAMALNAGDFYTQLEEDSRTFLDNYSVFKVLGGAGPYSPRRSDGIDLAVPKGYQLDQVVMFHRHGERFPEEDNSQEYLATLDKLSNATTPDGYEFLHSWTFYANDTNYGNETSSGPYSGIDGSKEQGKRFVERYLDLLSNDTLRIWTSDSTRVNATAFAFADGFFHGRDDLYNIIVVPEEKYANSLTPKCKGPEKTTCEGGETTRTPQFDEAADRLNADLGTQLDASDIENLMYVGLYEINVRGNSPWMNVFTPEEWMALEYIRSYRLFCKRAHGSPEGLASGSVLTNATAALLSQGPGGVVQPLTFAFLHDTQVSQIVGAAGLLNETNAFDSSQVTFGNQIKISDVVPMGANLAFERITNDSAAFVRVVMNEAVLPIDWCSSGPGYSCPLDEFFDGIRDRFNNFGWSNNCKTRHDDDPEEFTIFWE